MVSPHSGTSLEGWGVGGAGSPDHHRGTLPQHLILGEKGVVYAKKKTW